MKIDWNFIITQKGINVNRKLQIFLKREYNHRSTSTPIPLDAYFAEAIQTTSYMERNITAEPHAGIYTKTLRLLSSQRLQYDFDGFGKKALLVKFIDPAGQTIVANTQAPAKFTWEIDKCCNRPITDRRIPLRVFRF